MISIDGVPDTIKEKKEMFGWEHLFILVSEGNMSRMRLIAKINENLHQFMGGPNQFDDITLLAVERGD